MPCGRAEWRTSSRRYGCAARSEEHTSALQSPCSLVCRPLPPPASPPLPCTTLFRSHFLAQLLDIGSGGSAEIDQEIGVLLRDLRAADLQPTAAGRIDQLPCLVAGRIGERRAAGTAARLGVGAGRVDLVDASRDRKLV